MKTNLKRRLSILLYISFLFINLLNAEGVGDCGCSDEYIPGSPEWQICKEEQCSGIDVPVTDHLWVLLALGSMLAIYTTGAINVKRLSETLSKVGITSKN